MYHGRTASPLSCKPADLRQLLPESGVEHPLGGYKQSGIGREKGVMALKQYTQTKNIIIKI